MNGILFSVSFMCLVILLLIFILKKLRQPYMIAYILVGVIIGPHVSKIITEVEQTSSFGEIGILLLMFFLGMEMDVPDEKSILIKPLVAQSLKITFSIGFAILLGNLLNWPVHNILLLTILFVFNSTAVVSEYLLKNNELHSTFGKSILNILVFQDILLAPTLTVFQFIGQDYLSFARLASSLLACLIIIILLRAVRRGTIFHPPFLKDLDSNGLVK